VTRWLHQSGRSASLNAIKKILFNDYFLPLVYLFLGNSLTKPINQIGFLALRL
jgi:hypothetical protein